MLAVQLTDSVLALLCGLGYSLLSKGLLTKTRLYLDEVIDDELDCLVIACNLMAFMFLCDESTDKVDRSGARAYAEIVMDALRNHHTDRPQGEPKLGEVARRYDLSYRRAVGCPIDDDNDLLQVRTASYPSCERVVLESLHHRIC
jgi:hypothetical protein